MRPEGEPAPGAGPRSEQITIRPPFDPLEFARDADSTIRIAEAAPQPLPPTVPPPPGIPEYSSDTSIRAPHTPLAIDGDMVPTLAVNAADLDWFELPPLARRVLLQVDGCESVASICARCGLELAAGIRVLGDLAGQGLIAPSDTPD